MIVIISYSSAFFLLKFVIKWKEICGYQPLLNWSRVYFYFLMLEGRNDVENSVKQDLKQS